MDLISKTFVMALICAGVSLTTGLSAGAAPLARGGIGGGAMHGGFGGWVRGWPPRCRRHRRLPQHGWAAQRCAAGPPAARLPPAASAAAGVKVAGVKANGEATGNRHHGFGLGLANGRADRHRAGRTVVVRRL